MKNAIFTFTNKEMPKEITRIDVGLITLRVVQVGESLFCEKFESNKWNKLTPLKLHELSFNKRIYEWLNKHYNSQYSVISCLSDVRE